MLISYNVQYASVHIVLLPWVLRCGPDTSQQFYFRLILFMAFILDLILQTPYIVSKGRTKPLYQKNYFYVCHYEIWSATFHDPKTIFVFRVLSTNSLGLKLVHIMFVLLSAWMFDKDRTEPRYMELHNFTKWAVCETDQQLLILWFIWINNFISKIKFPSLIPTYHLLRKWIDVLILYFIYLTLSNDLWV